jgi:hypothetical protein
MRTTSFRAATAALLLAPALALTALAGAPARAAERPMLGAAPRLGLGTQSAAVKGTLLNGTVPVSDTKVKLFDLDVGPDPSDLMDAGVSASDGTFQLSGTANELVTLDVQVDVYTNVNVGAGSCQRKIPFDVPAQYVTAGSTPSMVYDLGSIDLSRTFPGETRACIN